MRSLLAKLFLIFGMLASSAGLAQGPIWQLDEIAAYRGQSDNRNKAYFSSEFQALRSLLRAAPAESSGDNSYLISLPKPDGSRARYSIVESPVMAPALADQFPEIKTYRIFGIDDPSAGGRVDITPRGFHAMVHTDRGRFTIDPEAGLYRVKWQKGGDGSSSFQCRTESLASRGEDSLGAGSGPAAAGAPAARIPSSLQVYRLAVSATVEYVTAVGGTQGAAMSEIATAVNRVNSIYERDLGIRLQLVANNEQLIELDGSPRVSPTNLDNNDLTSLINQNQSWIDTILGSANYDIGHIFSTANGGLAFTSSACSSGNKSKGGTGLATPSGETFYIDYVAHELGHQFGAEHSFNGTTGSCLTSRVGSSAYEPGSGSTIMAYAGICGAENIQQNSDATFNSWSIFQIGSYTSGAGNCYTTTSANNANDPTANAGLDRNIPMGTPFQLQGSGSDGDGDTLSYQWDQVNKGFSTNATTLGDDLGNNPLFRTYLPQPTGSRDFPALGTQVCGQTDLSEALPTRTRNLVFRLTVRDNKSGQAIDPVTVAVNSAIGPFRITSHTTASQITPGPVNVTWDVANTTAAPVSCANVDIDLLTFSAGHGSYSVTPLLSGTANDGNHAVTIPNNSNSRARFRVKCSNNIFYDVSDADLDIQGGSSFPTNGQTTFFNTNGSVLSAPVGCSTDPDVTPPVITRLGSTPVDIELGNTYVDAGATAFDNVDGNITVSIVTTSNVNTNVVGSYSVTYNVSDTAGNAATPVVRNVNVTPDMTPPLVTPPSNITVAAIDASGTAATAAAIAAFLNGASAFDNIDGVITAITNNAPAVFPLGVTTVTFSATDNAGNTGTAQATVTVTDQAAPVITLTGPGTIPIELGTPYSDLGAAAFDNIDGDISGGIVTNSNVNTNLVGSYSVTYNVSDAAGNPATQVIRTVIVTADATPPVITLNGSSSVNIELGNTYVDAGATATDNIDGDISGGIVTTSNVNTNAVGSYSVTYNVSDAAGNPATQVIRTVIVTADATPPVITLLGSTPVSIELGNTYVDAGATAADNIDGDISGGIVTTSNVNTNAVGSYSVTYNVSDAAGNPATQVIRTVIVTADATPPVITLLGSTPVSIELGNTYVDAGASAADNIDGNITGSIVTTSNVNTNVVGSYSVTYNVSDAAGNAATAVVRTVNVTADATPPVITLLGSTPVSIELGNTYVDAGASAADNIDGNITGGIVTTSNVNTNVVGSYSVTYNVSDAAGNAATAVVRTVNVTADATPPVITLLGSTPVSIELGNTYVDAGASAADNIDGNITGGIVTTSNVNTNVVGSYSVTYNVSDAAGNAATAVVRTVNVTADATPPVITLLGSTPVSIELGNTYVDAGATASDNIDGDISGSIASISTVNTNAVGSYSVIYNVSDAAGNAATPITRTVNVTADVTPPVITLLGSTPVSIELGNTYVDAGAMAADNIDGNITGGIVPTSTVNMNVVGSYSVTYNVSDAAGNAATAVTRTVNVTPDVTPPVITLLGSTPVSIELGNTYVDAGADAADNIDGNITGSIVTTSNVNTNFVGSYSVTYNVSDAAGNAATPVTRTVNVTADATPPVITLIGGAITLTVGENFTDPGATALDNIDGNLDGAIVVSGFVDNTMPGNYILSYNVSDAAGNAAAPVTRSVSVQDAAAPVVTPPASITVVATNASGTAASNPAIVTFLSGASAVDDVDPTVTVSNDAPAVFPLGLTTVTFSATDSSNNTGTATATITVADQTPPVITLSGSSPVNIELGNTYVDAGATATDNIDGDISGSIVTTSNVNTNAVGSYSVTYNVSDAAGNAATPVVRTVNVTADATPPVITLLGSTPVSIELGNTYVDAGTTASDNIDGDISGSIASISTVNTNAVGSYSVIYNVSDAAGNAATPVVRTVNVTADATPPVITLQGSTPLSIELGNTYVDAGAMAADNIDGNITGGIVPTSTVNTNAVGSYSVIYNVSDAAGNAATPITRTVNVTADVTPPVITLLGSTPVSIELGNTYVDAGAMAADNIDGNITGGIVPTSTVNMNVVGSYSVTYNVSDAAGNTATPVVRTVNVTADVTPPMITLLGSTTVPVELGTPYVDAGATALDNIDGPLTVVTNNPVNVNISGTYIITYDATDTAGNAAIQVARTVIVSSDVTAPVITLLGSTPVNIELGNTYVDAGASAADNVDGDISGSIATTSTVNTNVVGIYSVTYNIVDAGGNAATPVIRIVNVTPDVTAPVITLVGVNPVNIELGNTYVDAGAMAADNIDGNITGGIVPTSTVNTSLVGTYGVTYNVSDAAGNAATPVTRTVNVTEDVTAPVVTAPEDIVTASQGSVTSVALGLANAIDNVEGVILASPDQSGPFVPGRHQILWSATDTSGNTGFAIQFVDVQPLVEFLPDQLSEPGATVTIRVLLNGEAAAYPVGVNYEIFEGSNAIPSGSGVLAITSGIEGDFDYVIPGHILAGDINLNLTTVTNAVKGPMATHKVSVNSENVAPLARLEIIQNGMLTNIIAADGGPVTVQALVQDINFADNHIYDWSKSDNLLLASNPGTSDAQFMIDAGGFLPGYYKIDVKVTDDGLPNLDTEIELYLELVDTEPLLSNEDSDNDGIDDSTEGFGDADSDGIPDYLDGLDNPALMQAKAGVFDQWLMNAQPGLGIRLGTISLAAGRHSATINADDIELIAGTLGGAVLSNATDNYTNVGGYFDFEIHGLTQPGQAVLVVIPQLAPIPQAAVYRKYTETGGWRSFVEDSKNVLSSTAGEAGICPAPGDSVYVPGLNQGHYCVQLLIEDGGANDGDVRRNGIIKDPGGVARLSVAPPAASSGSGGGGSMGLFVLLLMLGLQRLNARLRNS